jgi:hypothetical protein
VHRYVLLLSIFLVLGTDALGAQDRAFPGVWRAVEVNITGPNARTLRPPQPRLFIFTERHYSRTDVTSDQPRVALADVATATADQLRAVWSPYTSNAGTYEASGGTLTIRPMVAKNPAVMAPGAFTEFAYRIQGDTLWLTGRSTELGPVANPTSYRYVGLE